MTPTTLGLSVSLAALLLAGCSDDPTPRTAPTSTGTPTPSATAASGEQDAYLALTAPTARAVGDYPELLVNRALQQAQGLVATQLLEDSTLTGSDSAALVESLTGAAGDLTIARDLGGAPTVRGLDYRPLFAPGVTVKAAEATVERSIWTTDAVQGLGGEQGLRVSWSGSVRYATTTGGRSQDVAFALAVAYVYSTVPNEPNGLALQQVVRGSSHAAPVVTACLAKGLLLPAAGTPTAADFGPSPWPTPTPGPACPV